ncbi:MAG: twin-arginine translocase TatA/TatE family subunit [Thermodesulfovibrionales bacterium]|nr:twin-arginine translocase TatA/TatE family subunit [Thermodesulfovibrionales bacterium]
MIGPLGATELIIILIIVLVLFGGRRLPELASSLGKAIKNFKKSTSEPDEIDVTPPKGTSEKVDKRELDEDTTKRKV